MSAGELHLIPVPLGTAASALEHMAPATIAAVQRLNYFIVEDEKSARHFLKSAAHPTPLRQILIERFDKDGTSSRAEQLLHLVLEGRSAGLLSEAGCPAVADPGALVVEAAHRHRLRVVPHIGPSAMLLGLMASGFNGQRYNFHGYLPIDKAECVQAIRRAQHESSTHNATQIFIETPHRNDSLLATLLETCDSRTQLCVATNLTLQDETVNSKTVAEWKEHKPEIGRRPSVFLLYARRS